MSKSFNFLFGALFVLLTLVSCKRAEVIELPMTIIIDHQLSSLNISSDKDLVSIISPFYTNNDSILISPKFIIQRIDLKEPLLDSIAEKEGGIVEIAQDWLVGGKKNDVKYKKIKEKNIDKKLLSLGFTIATGNQQYVDSFLKNNNIEYVFFVNDNVAYSNYKKLNLKVFNRIDSLQNFVRNSLSLAQSGKKRINIFYKPTQSYIRPNPDTIVRIRDTSKGDIVSKGGPAPIPPTSPKPLPIVDPKVTRPQNIYDPRIKYCRTISNDEDKLVFFFTEIFRFVRGSSYNSPDYKLLLKDIADIISITLPNNKDIKGNYKTSYLISCSNKTDFISECNLLNSSIDITNLKNIYNRLCP
jgi:hypothetical protein